MAISAIDDPVCNHISAPKLSNSREIRPNIDDYIIDILSERKRTSSTATEVGCWHWSGDSNDVENDNDDININPDECCLVVVKTNIGGHLGFPANGCGRHGSYTWTEDVAIDWFNSFLDDDNIR